MENDVLAPEQAPAQPMEPSNEEISASLGITQEQERMEGAPKPLQVPKPEQTQTVPDPNEALFKALQDKLFPELDKRLTPIQRELGQFRKLQAEQAKQPKPTYQPPTVWNELPPEQQKAYQDVVGHLIEQMIGEKMKNYDSVVKEYQDSQSFNKVYSLATGYAGKDWTNLEPIAAQIVNEANQARDNGDQSAAEFLDELSTTKAGVGMLINLARQRYSQTVEAQSKKATEAKALESKKASTGLTNSSKTESAFSAENLPQGNNPQARAARMKLYKEAGISE